MTWFGDLYKRFNIKKKLKRKKNNKKIDKNQQNRIEKYSRDLSDGQITESYNRNALNSVRSDSGWLNITLSPVKMDGTDEMTMLLCNETPKISDNRQFSQKETASVNVGTQDSPDNAFHVGTLCLQPHVDSLCYDVEQSCTDNYKPFDQVMHFAGYGDYVSHLQRNQIFTDVTVSIGTEIYAAHRMSLACVSGLFADIFYIQRNKQHVVLRLTGVKPVAFKVLLQYIYTSVLLITSKVVGDLMRMSEILRIPIMEPLLNDYMESLPLVHALDILVNEQCFGPFYDKILAAICEQFNTLRLEAEFLDIDIETILVIVISDNLNISSELDVFKAAIRWIEHNIMHRKQQLLKLMKCVKFPFMTPGELFHCYEVTSLLLENYDCRQMILEANWIASAQMLQKEDPFKFMVPNPRIKTTPVQDGNDVELYQTNSIGNVNFVVNSQKPTPNKKKSDTTGEIIVLGGFFPQSNRTDISAKSIDKYHSDDNEWKHCNEFPEPRLHFAVTIQNGTVYLTGGSDPRLKVNPALPTADAFIFETRTCAWIKIMPMNTARIHHSLASLNGMIYAIGGQDGNNRVLNTVECYNPKIDNWVFVKPMSEARRAASTGVIDGKLYTAGGYGESIRRPILDTVECFNPKKNKWQSKNKLRFPRGHANIVAVNDKLHLCGGVTTSFINRNSVISSVPSIDVYNKEQDVWEHCSDMVIARHSAGTACVGSLIYIIGGATTQYNRIFRSVECFDTDTKTWVSGVKDLPYPSKWIQCLSLN